MKKRILTVGEIQLIRRLCKPDPFTLKEKEVRVLVRLLSDGMVKAFGPNKDQVEVTNLGADCYIASMESLR